MPCRGLRHRRLNASAAEHIERIFDAIKDPYGQKKGDKNERIALELIKELIRKGVIQASRDPYITGHNSALDCRGVDIIVPTEYGDIGIQIKSSEGDAARFTRKHPHIPCIVIPKMHSKPLVSAQLQDAILRKFEWLKRGRGL